MTTYVFFDGVLAADTCISRDDDGCTREVGRMNKIFVNPLFAVVGTGRSRVVFFLRGITNLLALRWMGWAVVPNSPTYVDGEHNVLYVVWRNGVVWNFATRLERRWGFLLARRVGMVVERTRVPAPSQHIPLVSGDVAIAASVRVGPHFVSKGGSGGRRISLKEVARLGCVGSVQLAAARDDATNDQVIAFDTRTWAYTAPLPRFQPVDGTVWSVLAQRLDRLLARLRVPVRFG
jgi:hypothetical protein